MKSLLNSIFERFARALVPSRCCNTPLGHAYSGFAFNALGLGGPCAAAVLFATTAMADPGADGAAEGLHPTGLLVPGEVFDKAVDALAERYPFTEHKGIDWAQVRTEFRPALLEAEKAGDPAGAYVAWRRFVHGTLHDGHVTFWALPGTPAAEAEDAVLATITGGSYGIEVVRCDDGTVLVVGVDEAAAAQGLVFGARLFEWNGRPVAEALAQTDLVWAPTFGSRESVPVLREELFVRGAVGTTVTVRFVGSEQSALREAVLIAGPVDASQAPRYARSAFGRRVSLPENGYAIALREDGVGVLTLRAMQPAIPPGVDPATLTPEVVIAAVEQMVAEVHDGVKQLEAQGAKGLVVDLRNNEGGLDALGAMVAGLFDSRPRHYLTSVAYDAAARRWNAVKNYDSVMRLWGNPLYVQPAETVFGGRIAILVNPETVSAGEGCALRLSEVPGATVVGFFGSNGSFGNMADADGGLLGLGAGLLLSYPIERCVDERGRILLDADSAGRGGVIPQVRVPRTPATMHALFAEGRDVEMETAAALLLAAPSDTAIPAISPAEVKATLGASVELSAPAEALGYQWFEGERGDTSRPVAGGGATLKVIVGTETTYWVRLYQAAGARDSAAVPVGARALVEAPTLTTQPADQSVVRGTSARLSVAATGTAPLTYQWFRNGRPLQGATRPSLDFFYFDVVNAGIYDVVVSGSEGALSRPAVIGVVLPAGLRSAGTVTTRDEWQNIRHPNGTVYDQFLLTGAAGAFSADPGEIARMSYLDNNDSIVQVELSGAGSVTVALDNSSGPSAPLLYEQPGIRYMKGKATIILAGADASTHFTIYSVGKANNPGVVRPELTYPGWADVAVAGIVSTDGKLGGIHHGNVAYSSSIGLTGIYAPDVISVGGSSVVHSIAASGAARPYLYFGAESDVHVTIAGSALVQPNGDSIAVGGLGGVMMGGGEDSCRRAAPARDIQATLLDDAGTDVTPVMVVGP
ncbi:MAG: hypothetical protein IPL39_05585 [Opitutaceae bacterium]|nr:hypothetical protein [Opitutaceae bacterium]